MTLMTDIIWRSPAEFQKNLSDNRDITEFTLLLKDKQGEYSCRKTGVIGHVLCLDPLPHEEIGPVFNPFAYELIAIVAY